MRYRSFLSVVTAMAVVGLTDAGLAAPGEAVLVVAPGGGNGLLPAVRAEVERVYTVVPATGIAVGDAACAGDAVYRPATEIVSGVREGARLFYQDVEVDGAIRALSGAIDAFAERPCVFGRFQEKVPEVCTGAVLLVRCLLYAGRTDAAAAAARRVAMMFPAGMVEAVDTPPEVASYLAGVRTGMVSATVTVRVTPEGEADGATLLADGRSVEGRGEWVVTAPAGGHVFTLLLRDGTAVTHRIDVPAGGMTATLDVATARRLSMGPEGILVLAAEGGSSKALGMVLRIAAITGRDVILVGPAGEGAGLEVTVVDASGRVQGKMMSLVPVRDRKGWADVEVDPRGPLVRRPSWPWPWVAFGASAGLLGAGVALNLTANRDAAAVNGGSNRSWAYRWHRGWAIGCYSAAGAAAVAGAVLAFVRPGPTERFRVGPMAGEGGPMVGVAGRF